jgi:hypothetical protein
MQQRKKLLIECVRCNRQCLGDTVRRTLVAKVPAFAFDHTPMGVGSSCLRASL